MDLRASDTDPPRARRESDPPDRHVAPWGTSRFHYNARMKLHAGAVVAGLVVCAVGTSAQPPLFTTSVPKEEFAARRAKVMEQIGDGVLIMQGATETSSYEKFRHSNQFYYLT